MTARALPLIVLGLAILAGCSVSPPQPGSGVYSGYYRYGFELSEFTPKGTSETWWLSGDTPAQCVPHYKNRSVGTAYITVRATLSDAGGGYGHMGAYSRQLTVHKFIRCRAVRPEARPQP